MAATLAKLPLIEQLPSSLRVTRVDSDELHALLSRIQVETLGQDFAPRAAMKRLFGLSPSGPVAHLLGWVGNRPVASATLMCFGEPASIWGVATIPEARGHGIGRAMTLEACRLAHSRGHRTVSLYATPMGLPLYAGLGFRECGSLALYTAP
ncbi:MAG: GNAT family N-acetyltransferase [Candidatus Marsarchaeota archaeon]|nr:GNAT family N-acetyltransferase [Candidatus Marsarchaeota archaeon]